MYLLNILTFCVFGIFIAFIWLSNYDKNVNMSVLEVDNYAKKFIGCNHMAHAPTKLPNPAKRHQTYAVGKIARH